MEDLNLKYSSTVIYCTQLPDIRFKNVSSELTGIHAVTKTKHAQHPANVFCQVLRTLDGLSKQTDEMDFLREYGKNWLSFPRPKCQTKG